ncbi:MAG: D-2-hydroxyacid dehydrogenase [Oscillospiraceae bacterium]|nr:D-2-hydroxyacid dehydrogenase [Oscillospiraceae bacterium]
MKIVILDGYAANPGDLSWDGLRQYGELTVYDRTKPEQIVPRIGAAEIVLTNKAIIDDAVMAQCPNLKLVSVLATGYNVVDLEAARKRGITVCNVPAYSTPDVAQMTFALLLEICQHVGLHSQAVHSGKWCSSRDFCFWDAPLLRLAGKTMGLVGFGSIGRQVAAIAQAFGMDVLVSSRTPHPEAESAHLRFCSTDEMLQKADVVTLHCPLTEQTKELIDADALAKMKDGAILINTARGGVIDEAAVAAALKSGKLSAFGADVVSVEPIRENNPLLGCENAVLTPHIAWATKEARTKLLAVSAANVGAFLAGKPQNVVN